MVTSLIYELRRRGGGLGLATMCAGGGQGGAVLIEV
jgi:acetyl-CoA acyltransferase